jgi:Zn-dependent metalloprotease
MLKGSQIIYKGTYWYAGTADSGGIHTNSGVFKSLVLYFI